MPSIPSSSWRLKIASSISERSSQSAAMQTGSGRACRRPCPFRTSKMATDRDRLTLEPGDVLLASAGARLREEAAIPDLRMRWPGAAECCCFTKRHSWTPRENSIVTTRQRSSSTILAPRTKQSMAHSGERSRGFREWHGIFSVSGRKTRERNSVTLRAVRSR